MYVLVFEMSLDHQNCSFKGNVSIPKGLNIEHALSYDLKYRYIFHDLLKSKILQGKNHKC